MYLNLAGTIVEQALALMLDKLAAASGFRGETLEGVLGEVASSGAFMDELLRRVIANADVTEDLETWFARFCRQEVERDEFLRPYDLGITDAITAKPGRHGPGPWRGDVVAATRHTQPAPPPLDPVYQPGLPLGDAAGGVPLPVRTVPVEPVVLGEVYQPAMF